MKVNVRGRRLKITPEMEDYATEKVGKFDRFFAGIQHADVVMEVAGLNHHVEISVLLGQGARLFGKAEAEDMYAAIDMAEGKLEKQIRRFHARLKAHRDRTRIVAFFERQKIAGVKGKAGATGGVHEGAVGKRFPRPG